MDETGVELRLSTRATPELLSGFDQVVLATGVTPRRVDFPGHDHPTVVGYLDVLQRRVVIGGRVDHIGSGGLGLDVAQFPAQAAPPPTPASTPWVRAWGLDRPPPPRRPSPQRPTGKDVELSEETQ